MRLPSLTVIVVSLAIIWSIAGTSIHGPLILLYPAAWLAVAAGFVWHSKTHPLRLTTTQAPSVASGDIEGQKPAPEETQTSEPAKLAATD